MRLKSEIQFINDEKHSVEMFFLAFDQRGKVLQSQERMRKKKSNATEVGNMTTVRVADLSLQISHLIALSHYMFIYKREILERRPQTTPSLKDYCWHENRRGSV